MNRSFNERNFNDRSFDDRNSGDDFPRRRDDFDRSRDDFSRDMDYGRNDSNRGRDDDFNRGRDNDFNRDRENDFDRSRDDYSRGREDFNNRGNYDNGRDDYDHGRGDFDHGRGGYDRGQGRRSYNSPPRKYRAQNVLKELASKALYFGTKKIYLDLVESGSKKLFKLVEVTPSGQKNKILFALIPAEKFLELLIEYADIYDNLENKEFANRGVIKSESFFYGPRKYYFDLKENRIGIFMKVAMCTPMERIQVAIPSKGLRDVRDAVEQLINRKFESDPNKDEKSIKKENLESESDSTKKDEPVLIEISDDKLVVGNRTFNFDIKETGLDGQFLRLTEMSGTFRSSIDIPENCWKDIIRSIELKISQDVY